MKTFDRHSDNEPIDRREFIKRGAALAGSAAFAVTGHAHANHHPHPHEGSLTELDPNTYINNLAVHAHFNDPGHTAGKMQMMAVGERRLMFTRGDVWEVTDPLKPTMINEGGYIGGQIQLAYNSSLGRWILMTSSETYYTSGEPAVPYGKYEDPRKIDWSVNWPGLRGVRLYDATDPMDIKLLSRWSVDQGDPGRVIQTGSGTHRNYYDGGRYAYLDGAPDNSFVHVESPIVHYSNCLQIIDLEDPANPEFVSNWWVPGQRIGEERDYMQWREYGDKSSFTCSHGAFYVPQRVEDGGRYCYCSYGSFGLTIHDISDPYHPELVGDWRPPYLPGAIATHTADVTRIDRGFVMLSSETLDPDCFEPFHDNYIVDVRDPSNPQPMSSFGRWQPPPEAPYDTFCDKRGRYGTHNPPHLKAPGTPSPNFTAYAAFNAGLRTMDISDPANPRVTGWFIPPSAGSLNRPRSYHRLCDSVFVEWDRRLIWAGFDSGTYLLSHPDLGEPVLEPMQIAEWSLAGLNEGWDA